MTCLPTSCRCGECEQRRLVPFVRHYNAARKTSFEFERRLDATGPTPQPEAAYLESSSGRHLVIERKSLIWPSDFGQLHASTHDVWELVDAGLHGVLDSERAYRLSIRDDLRGSRAELQAYGLSIVREVTENLAAIHEGRELTRGAPGREWQFEEESPADRDFTEPNTGLICDASVVPSDLDEGIVCDGFVAEFQRLLNAAARKFDAYAAATRVLVVEPYADVRWSTDETWRSLFEQAEIPQAVEEVWMSMHGILTELLCGWIHKPLWPVLGTQHYELCRAPATQ